MKAMKGKNKKNKKKLDGTNYTPGCTCDSLGLEPDDLCYIHGFPDYNVCPYCGQFRGRSPCKRCGCAYSLPKTGLDAVKDMIKDIKIIIEDLEIWLSKPERDYIFNLMCDTENISLISKAIYKELYEIANDDLKRMFPKRLR